MIISSREESTIDYPGKFGQILFAPGCSFRCGFCHNPDLFTEKNKIDLDYLLKDIGTKAKGGWYKAVCISGGEPTLQDGLVDFTIKLKQLGLLVKVDSNGSRPKVIQELLDSNSVEYLAMDIKAPFEKYNEITSVEVDIEDIKKSIELVKQFPISEFRTTVIPNLTKEDFDIMGRQVTEDENGEIKKVKIWGLNQFVPEFAYKDEYKRMIPKEKDELNEIVELMKKYAEEVRLVCG